MSLSHEGISSLLEGKYEMVIRKDEMDSILMQEKIRGCWKHKHAEKIKSVDEMLEFVVGEKQCHM